MSYTEFHKGKFKIVARGDEAIKKYIKDNNLEERIELNINKETGKIEYLEDTAPFNHDMYDHEYNMITYKRCLSNSYNRNPNAEHLLIRYLEHEYFELAGEDIDIHRRISKDEFEFAISFYNGGTYALEIYEDILDKFDLDAEYENESSTEITTHEAIMISGICNYILNDMIIHGFQKLYDKYTKEEISNLKQRLENIIKNN